MKTTEHTLRKMLLEIALGSDPSAGMSDRDDKATTIRRSSVVPISPSMESPVQLSVQSPPILDPEFCPANKIELARSLSSIGELVNDEAIEDFYTSVKELYKKMMGEEIA
jgi:hypothetical protein